MPLKESIKEFKAYLGNRESLLDMNHKRISEMIELHWGYKEIYLYINKLLVVNKERNRQGFPLEAIQEIYALQGIHTKLFPETNVLSSHSLPSTNNRKTICA